MDINDLRVMVTLLSFVLFIALAVHTWSRRRNPEHEAAARLPFADEDGGQPGQAEQGTRRAP
ncbi:MAG: cbb3-type cytochrome c oxidase subunit 3 [Rubrivivax sp.]|nr:cbb3-type cytochrome c oxidase subunit 3 [Rubrivivax sp.]